MYVSVCGRGGCLRSLTELWCWHLHRLTHRTACHGTPGPGFYGNIVTKFLGHSTSTLAHHVGVTRVKGGTRFAMIRLESLETQHQNNSSECPWPFGTMLSYSLTKTESRKLKVLPISILLPCAKSSKVTRSAV